jgi:hypothetical protein
MKKGFLFLLVFLSIKFASAQGSNFVYLQTEPQESFYVKINGELLSSSASGYLIISRLVDSIYSIAIGFPESKWKEQQYNLPVYKAGIGYILKFSQEKGWVLVDLKSKKSISPVNIDAESAAKAIQKSNPAATTSIKSKEKELAKPKDSFASLLARASGDDELLTPMKVNTDTLIAIKTMTVSVPVKKDSVVSSVKSIVSDPPIVKESELVKVVDVKLENVLAGKVESSNIQNNKKVNYQSVVTKTAESSTTEGFGLQFIDKYSTGQIDTIRLLIPSQKQVAESGKNLDQKVNSNIDSFVHCKALASYDEYLLLEKNMKQAVTDAERLSFAKKEFANMCFNCEQIKRLSMLIVNQETKYNFFLDAYQSTSNRSAFGAMLNELNEKEIAERFKLLLN